MNSAPPSFAAELELHGLYAQWNSLTQAEGGAIRAGAWSELARLQASKAALQPAIQRAHEALEHECAVQGEPDRNLIEREFRPVVEKLVTLERQNLDQLNRMLEQAGAQRRELETAARTLRHVHQAYAQRRESVWQSYR